MGKLKRPAALANVRGYNSAFGYPNDDPEIASVSKKKISEKLSEQAGAAQGLAATLTGHADAAQKAAELRAAQNKQADNVDAAGAIGANLAKAAQAKIKAAQDAAPKPAAERVFTPLAKDKKENMWFKRDAAGNPVAKTEAEIQDFAMKQAKENLDLENRNKKGASGEKPKWNKQDEQKARYAQAHEGQIPDGKIFTGSTNEAGDPSVMHPWQEGLYDTSGWQRGAGENRAPGTTSDADWSKLFDPSAVTKSRPQLQQNQARGLGLDGNNGNFVQMGAPINDVMGRHFRVPDWARISPEDKAAMIRKDAGIPEPMQQFDPVAAEQPHDFTPDTGPYTGQTIPGVVRTAYKGGVPVGFATQRLPAAVPVQPAMIGAGMPLPSAVPLNASQGSSADDIA